MSDGLFLLLRVFIGASKPWLIYIFHNFPDKYLINHVKPLYSKVLMDVKYWI